MKYTKMGRIFSKLTRDYGPGMMDEGSVIEWTGEALEFINAIRYKEEAVAFLNVENYQTELPSGLHNIIQIAKNQRIDNPDTYNPEKSENDEKLNPEADHPVCLDCNGMPYNDYDVAYYRPYYDLQYEYHLWGGRSSLSRCYVPVRLSNNSFFNSLVCSENGTDCGHNIEWSNGLYTQSEYEYTVVHDNILRFNFEKGLIALAYNRTPTDEEGLPMIPDHATYTTAIISYIVYKHMQRQFFEGREGAGGRLAKAESDWNWYCKQASNKSLIPQGIDELENLKEQRNYIVPRRNVYQNYFGNLNNREIKNMLQSYRRNNAYYGRGEYTANPSKVI